MQRVTILTSEHQEIVASGNRRRRIPASPKCRKECATMKRLPAVCFAIAGVVFTAGAIRGQSASSPAAAPPAATAATATTGNATTAMPAPGKLLLQEGTEIDLKFGQDLSSKTAEEGDSVELTLAQDVKVGDVVVARAGCPAVGEVTHVKKAGMMGKGGELNIRLDYLKVGGTRVMLRGSKGREGNDATGATVALTVLFGPIGLIKHGKNIEIKQGTPLKAYVDSDTSLLPAPPAS
jgi:hypothetical protein